VSDSLRQEILKSILHADSSTTLSLLKEAKGLFLEPVKGTPFHAKAMYYSIKKANKEVLNWLTHLPVKSDISFFKLCGNTPIGVAIEDGHQELLGMLITRTDKNFALHMAVKLKFSKTIQVLLAECSFKDRFLNFLQLKS